MSEKIDLSAILDEAVDKGGLIEYFGAVEVTKIVLSGARSLNFMRADDGGYVIDYRYRLARGLFESEYDITAVRAWQIVQKI